MQELCPFRSSKWKSIDCYWECPSRRFRARSR